MVLSAAYVVMALGLNGKVGLDFDLSAISSGIYGFLLLIIMLLRPQGLLPGRGRRTSRSAM